MTDRDDWIAEKAKAISSTEVSALFGMSPYQTAYELGVEKQSGKVGEFAESERMTWGKRLQDAIAQGIADDHGVLIEGSQYEFMHHPTVPRMGSSFDYRIVGVSERAEASPIVKLFYEHGPGLLEIKNVDSLVYKNWPKEEAPEHIEIQVQHQLEVAELKWAVLAVFVGGNRTVIYLRMRDEEVGIIIAQKVRKFWADFDKGILPPPVLPADANIIIKLNQYADPNSVFNAQGDETLATLCEEYLSAGEVARQASEAQKSIKAQIFTYIGHAEKALLDQYRLSAAMRAPVDIKAHTRAGYRDIRITRLKNE